MKITQQQAGLSLIEMMIAMVLGLFLLIATTMVYFSSQRSSVSRSEYAALEDNGRSALEVLTRIIEHTGYISNSATPLDESFITSAVIATNCGGAKNVLKPALFGTISNGVSDSVGVVYIGDASLNRDCSGAQLPVVCQAGGVGSVNASKIYNYFSVGVNAAGVPALNCAGSRSADLVEIAEGVENIQVLYGLDNNADSRVDQYVNATKVGSWNNVISVQLAILVRSLRDVKTKAETKKYKLLDSNTITTNDKYQRAVFSTIVRLRNVQL